MIVRFVDIGGIVDHHCLNVLFINVSKRGASSGKGRQPHTTSSIQRRRCHETHFKVYRHNLPKVGLFY